MIISAAFCDYIFHKIMNYLIVSHTLCFSCRAGSYDGYNLKEEHIFGNEIRSAGSVGWEIDLTLFCHPI